MSSQNTPKRLGESEDLKVTIELPPESSKATRKLNELEKRLFDMALGEMPPEEMKLFDPDLALEILTRRRPSKWAEVKHRGAAKPMTPNGQGAKLVEEYLRKQGLVKKDDKEK